MFYVNKNGRKNYICRKNRVKKWIWSWSYYAWLVYAPCCAWRWLEGNKLCCGYGECASYWLFSHLLRIYTKHHRGRLTLHCRDRRGLIRLNERVKNPSLFWFLDTPLSTSTANKKLKFWWRTQFFDLSPDPLQNPFRYPTPVAKIRIIQYLGLREKVTVSFCFAAGVNFLTADGLKFSHPLYHLGKSTNDLPVLAIDSFRHMYLFPHDIKGQLE